MIVVWDLSSLAPFLSPLIVSGSPSIYLNISADFLHPCPVFCISYALIGNLCTPYIGFWIPLHSCYNRDMSLMIARHLANKLIFRQANMPC
jgi:hypothetical protein